MKNRESFNPAAFFATAGVLVLLCIFPFVVTNGYLNITITRYYFFNAVSVLFFVLTFVSFFAFSGEPLNKPFRTDSTDIFMLLFLISAVLSFAFSKYPDAALSGAAGRRMGLLIIIAEFFTYAFITRFYRIRKTEIVFFAVCFVFMITVAVIQCAGFNPFGLYDGIRKGNIKDFVSFLGNLNVFSSYVCIGAGLFMGLFCFTGSPVWCICSAFSYLGLFVANSDSGYLGIGSVFILLLIISGADRLKLSRFFTLLTTFFISCGIFRILMTVFADTMRKISTITRNTTSVKIFLPCLVLSLILTVTLYKADLPERCLRIIHLCAVAAVVLFLLSSAAAVIYFTFFDTVSDLGKLTQYVRFNDMWGTGRGYIWKKLLDSFIHLPLINKLVGYGEETVFQMVSDIYGENIMVMEMGSSYDNAHNDLIQYLVTMGLWGVLSYTGLVFCSLRNSARSENNYRKSAGVAVFAYFIQSLVNITQPITTPLVFVLFALTYSGIRNTPRSASEP